jgi:hypothetical protein
MNYLTNYYKNLCEQLQGKIALLEEKTKKESKPKSLPFEITGIDAPLAYGKKYFEPDVIGIYGWHVRPDGSRGPEVNIPVHAFEGMHHNDVIYHAEDFMLGRHKASPDNPFFKSWDDQAKGLPGTFQVDPSKIESIEEYNKRVRAHGL